MFVSGVFIGWSPACRDLSFKKNDTVLLRKQVDENWYHGELLDGHQGFFPATYVQVRTLCSH